MEKSPLIIPWMKTLQIIYRGTLLIPQWSHFPNWSLLQDLLTPLAMKCQLQSIRGWEGKCAYLFSFFNAKSEGFRFKWDFVGPLRPKNNNGGRQTGKTELWYTLTVLFISATHDPNKKHVTSIRLVFNNFTASLRFLFKQLKAKVLCMFFLEVGSVVLSSFVTVESIVGLETSMMGNFSPPSPREIYRPLSKDWGFLTNIPTKLPALGKARRFPGGTRYIFQCTSMSNTSNDAEEKVLQPLFALDHFLSLNWTLGFP